MFVYNMYKRTFLSVNASSRVPGVGRVRGRELGYVKIYRAALALLA